VFETGSSTKEYAKIYYKSSGGGIGEDAYVQSGQWVLLGSPDWIASHPVNVGGSRVDTLTPGLEFVLNQELITISNDATFADRLETLITDINLVAGVSAREINGRLYLYTNGKADSAGDSSLSGSIIISAITGSEAVFTQLGINAGTYLAPKLTHAPHTRVPTYKRNDNTSTVQGVPTGSVWIKTTEPNFGARWRVNKWNTRTASWEVIDAPIYEDGHEALFSLDRSGGGENLPVNTVFVQYNASEDVYQESQYRLWYRAASGRTEIVSSRVGPPAGASSPLGPLNGTESFTIQQSVPGSSELVSAFVSASGFDGSADDAEKFAALVRSANFGFDNSTNPPTAIPSYIGAEVTEQNQVRIFHRAGGEIRFVDGTGKPISNLFTIGTTANFYLDPKNPGGVDNNDMYLASNWKPLANATFIASGITPLEEAIDGQLWYNPAFGEVDIMVHDGDTWKGYKNVYPDTLSDGPIVSASTPVGTDWVDRQLWISTADLENFPTIYRWDFDAKEWTLIDKADQSTADGVLFADARYGASGPTGDVKASITDLLSIDYLDPDAPDPDLYPRGMLLWNLRRSGGNVKRFQTNYINRSEDNPRMNNASMVNYATDRWVTASANNEDGSGSFGRKAQRKVVVAAMKSIIDTNEQIRDEERRNFNIIAAPGYPEVLSNLINLNIDRGLTAFVIGDTPLRLKSDATTLVNWGTNANLVFDNGDDGIVSFDEYAAVYYPNGFTTDLGGNNAVVPASHMMLRTIALSDQVSYPWFAPAGTRRGGITNATAVGYIDAATGEFQTVALNEGTRDVLYDLKVNPIPFFVGVGHVAFGQKTRGRNASALDRINVARLVVYLRSQLNKLARPYIFEPNDKITRDEIKGAVESLLLELVGLRAIFDFAVVCDESNNTPSRIDRNELYVDIAIEPVKAIEFIYIPLRVKNTGEI
jgi:hypothetical protein